MLQFRVFISSPSDAAIERRRLENVISRLNGEFAGLAQLTTVRWETEFYKAHETFQTQIPPAADCEIVIGILKWRLGTELPPDFKHLPDGEPYPSGTAYELLSAIEKRKAGSKLPDVFVFRYVGGSPNPPLDDPNRGSVEREWATLRGFFERWFVTRQGHFIAALNGYKTEDDFEHQLETLLRKWLATQVAGGRVVLWPVTKGSPFRGLSVFGARHAPVFYGRAVDIRRAMDLWRDHAAKGVPYILIVGTSGAGKSSLARAGLIPRLTTPGVVPAVDLWRVAVVRPGDSPEGPFMALAAALLQRETDLSSDEEGRGAALPEIFEGDSKTPAELATLLSHADAGAVRPITNALDRVGARAVKKDHYDRTVRCDLVLLVDQLDELFGPSVAQDVRVRFADLMAALVASGRIWLVSTLRADLYAQMLDVTPLGDLKRNGASYDLKPPGAAELAEIVRAPCEAAALTFEADVLTGERLDERLLREADRPDMLPLVQLALSRLWEARITKGGVTVLTLAAFDKLGGVKGIIEAAGKSALAAVGETERSRLPPLIRRLAELSHGTLNGPGSLSARPVSMAEAAPDAASKTLIDALVTARLLTLSGQGDAGSVRLTHQRVLTDWAQAAAIVTDSADFYRIRDEVEIQRERWVNGDRRSELLLARGLPLAEARALVAKYGGEVASETKVFIDASRRRANLGLVLGWAAAIVFGFVAIGAIVAAKVVVDQRQQAEAARTVSNQRLWSQLLFRTDLARQRNAAGDHATAMALALDALPDPAGGAERPYVPEAELQLFLALRDLHEISSLGLEGDAIRAASFSPDGKMIVAGANDGAILVLDGLTGHEEKVLRLRTSGVTAIDVAADNVLIAIGYQDNTAIIAMLNQAEAPRVLACGGAVKLVKFSPDGSLVATLCGDKVIDIWSTSTGRMIASMANIDGAISFLTFAADGKSLLAGGWSDAVHVWSVATGATIGAPLDVAGGAPFTSGTFSPKGDMILTTASNGTAQLWDRATHQMKWPLVGHRGAVNKGVFSQDETLVATTGDDGTARIWNVDTGFQTNIFTLARADGARAAGEDLALSPNGTRLVTAADDLREWLMNDKAPIGLFVGNLGPPMSVSFSSDGLRLLTLNARRGGDAGEPQSATLWRQQSAALVATLSGHQSGILSAAFSINGTRVATASLDKTIRVFDAATGKPLLELVGHKAVVRKVRFSPNGRWIVSASDDGTAIVWDASTGHQLNALRSHDETIWDADFSPDGQRVVVAGGDGSAQVWDWTAGRALFALSGDGADVVSSRYSHDGTSILTASKDGSVRLWNAGTGAALRTLLKGKDSVWSANFSNDNRFAVVAADRIGVLVLDIGTGATVLRLPGAAVDASFVTRDQRIAVVDGSGSTGIFDIETGAEVAEYPKLPQLGWAEDQAADQPFAALSADGSRIVVPGPDNTAMIWRAFVDSAGLVAAARNQVPRALTAAERRQFFIDRSVASP